MKKVITICLSLILMLSMSTTAFAYTIEFNDGPANLAYNRTSALNYLNSYTKTANSDYYDYTNLGGDCTNFVSQMLRAGGMQMTARKDPPTSADWYYYGSALPNRSYSWTGAGWFRTYWGVINGTGYKKASAMYKFTNSELRTCIHNLKRRVGGSFSAIPRCVFLQYTKCSCENAPCLAKKSLAHPASSAVNTGSKK